MLSPADGYGVDWHKDAANYRSLFGDKIAFRPWHAAGDLSGFNLVLPLLAWGYQRDPARWYDLLGAWQGLPFANTLDTVRWNTNKAYLLDLQARGVPIVPTRLAPSLCQQDLTEAVTTLGDTNLVVKPTISGGAEGTYRVRPGEPVPAMVAGVEMLIQPLVPAIADEGEYSLFYFSGQFSHAILKRPAVGDFRVQEQFGGTEIAIDPPAACLNLAQTALDALPEPTVYARVDMVRSLSGAFWLMELELIEPSLFLSHAPDRGAMFADTVRRAAEMRRTG